MGCSLKNDEMAIPVAAHHLWLSLPQRPLVLFSRQTVSSVCPLHREVIGILLAPAAFWMFGLPDGKLCLWLLLPLVLDGGIQRLTRYESGNIRRLLTGILFGYALVGLLVLSTIGAARWGYQLGKQLAV